MHRVQGINFLIDRYFKDAKYLEIGVADPASCFNHINTVNKIGVDPEIEHVGMDISYRLTSNNFFEQLESGSLSGLSPQHKWDIIFIDGLHLAQQVYQDIINSLNHVSDGGFILLHDCNPPTWKEAHSDHLHYLNNIGEFWNGTVWKAFYKFRTETKYKTYTIDTDQGIGVIETGKFGVPIPHENPWYEYGVFSKNREYFLNLISVNQFVDLHK